MSVDVSPAPAPLILCPKCFAPWPGNVGQRASHLIDVHDVSAMTAMGLARDACERESPSPPAAPAVVTTPSDAPLPSPAPTTEAPRMPRPCGECGVVGHARKTCPQILKRLTEKKTKPTKERKAKKPAAAPRAASSTTSATPESQLREQLGKQRALLVTQLAKIDDLLKLIDDVFPAAAAR